MAYGPDNTVTGYSARILSDHDDHRFGLTYLYHAKRKVGNSRPGDEHEGVTILSLIEGSPRRLEGIYLNDRDPRPRKADIEVQWQSSKLKNEL
jgi:hypothetical protein